MSPFTPALQDAAYDDNSVYQPHHRWFVPARVLWVVVVLASLGMFVVAVPAYYRQLMTPPEDLRQSLAQSKLSLTFFAGYLSGLVALFSLTCFGVAAVISYRKWHHDMALLTSVLLVLMGAANAPYAAALMVLYPEFTKVVDLLFSLLATSLILFLFLFPNGQFIPRWLRWVALVLAVGIAFLPFFSPSDSGQASPDTYLLLLLGFGVGVAAQIYRYLNTSNYAQRQQTRWVVYGVAMALMGQFAFMALDSFVSASLLPADLKATPYNLIDITGVTLAYLLIPLSIGVSVLRYQLWDIECVVNRTLVYAALTACVIGGYVFLVGGLGVLFQVWGNFFLSLVATGFIAVLFQPLRERLQKAVNRFMYGERDDPYAVLSKLNARLGSVLEPASILPTVVQTIAETLKLPYVALTIREGDNFTLAASTGTSGGALTLPLLHQHEAVGQLLLGPRGGERFSIREEKLFSDLAHQAAEAVQAVRLNAELQRSRQRLVTLREEERRRIRRDLHDGLGPTLVGINLQAGALLKLMADNAEAHAVVSDLRGEIRKAIADIRHLVYELRPPALDELGLGGALRAYAQRCESGLHVSIEIPETLPPLPAAVEVAVYRIAQEALTNVVKHAQAGCCWVTLELDDSLRLNIIDDGVGLTTARGAGVGLHAMHERAAEIGGAVVIGTVPGGGTRVQVSMPLPKV